MLKRTVLREPKLKWSWVLELELELDLELKLELELELELELVLAVPVVAGLSRMRTRTRRAIRVSGSFPGDSSGPRPSAIPGHWPSGHSGVGGGGMFIEAGHTRPLEWILSL